MDKSQKPKLEDFESMEDYQKAVTAFNDAWSQKVYRAKWENQKKKKQKKRLKDYVFDSFLSNYKLR